VAYFLRHPVSVVGL